MTKLKSFQQRNKSVIAEEFQEEFQVQPSTVTAVLKNKEKYRADFQYLDSTSLKGESGLDEDLPKMYAMYSEHYSGQKLSEQAVRSILEAEVEQCAKPASYMEIWQLHTLSNILNCKLMSILNVAVLQTEGTSTDGSLLSQSHLLFNGHRWQSCGPPHKARNRKPKIGW